MDKSTFIDSADAPRSLAEAAWEEADGDEDRARELLDPGTLKVKLQFFSPSDGYYGLAAFEWAVSTSTHDNLNKIVLGDSEVKEVTPTLSYSAFNRRIEGFTTGGTSMGGSTDRLGEALESTLKESGSSVVDALDNQNFKDLDQALQSVISRELEIENVSVTTDVETQREIESKASVSSTGTAAGSGASSDVDDAELFLQCSVRINPVSGVPITKISPGDSIFVEITEVPEGKEDLVDKLRSNANDDGMIPARLASKKHSDAGNLRLEVDLSEDIKGTISCGRDVSVLVPDSTHSQLGDSASGLPNFLTDEIFIGTALAIIFILLVGLWFYT